MRLPPLRCLLLLCAGAAGLALWSSAPAIASQPCWEQVIDDWAVHGKITSTYPATCYRQAMANAPTDLKIYSSIEDDLQSALAARTARRLTASPATVTRLDLAGSSSSFPVLLVLVGSLGAAVVAGSVGASLVRRRASGPRSRA
jgi:hypothetical protein